MQQGRGGEVSSVRPSPFPHTTPWRLVEFEFYKGGWLAWYSLSVAPIFIHAQSTACVGCSLGQEKENSVRVEVWSSVLGGQWSYQSQLLVAPVHLTYCSETSNFLEFPVRFLLQEVPSGGARHVCG